MNVGAREYLPNAEERTMLRVSLLGFLETHSQTAGAVEHSHDAVATASLWQGLVGQGLALLGGTPEEGGLREVVIVMEELGRAAAPAPQIGAALVNLALAKVNEAPAKRLLDRVQCGEGRVAVAFGELDPDASASSLTWGLRTRGGAGRSAAIPPP